jgi:hypothetical protein
MKIMMLDYTQDLPLEKIETILKKALHLYKSGIIKV